MKVRQLTTLGRENVDDFLLDLQQAHARAPRDELSIDLRHLTRLERPAGALLANMLISTLDRAPLRLRLAPDKRLDWLAATGVAFAVANRSGETLVEGLSVGDLDDWREPWSTCSADAWRELTAERPLFGPEEIGETPVEPHLFGPRYAAFVDAHLAPVTATFDHPLTDVIWPWLERLLPKRCDDRIRSEFIGEIGKLVSESIGNVREHAASSERQLHSLVQVAITRGGRGSHDRLHLVVLDNGRGVASTARGKIAPTLRATLSDSQLLFKLCDGSMPPWGRGRGMGLPAMTLTVRRLNGTMRLWTKTTRVHSAAAIPPLTAGDGSALVEGTVIAITVPLLG